MGINTPLTEEENLSKNKNCKRKTCLVCKKVLYNRNVSGYCLICFNKYVKRVVKDSFCLDCQKLLNRYHPGQRCYKCSAKKRVLSRNMWGKNNPNYQHGKVCILCDWCKKNIFRWEKQLKQNNFCDKICYGKWRSQNICGEKHHNFIHGRGNFPYPIEFSDNLKYNIRKRDNFTCQHCGLKEETHTRDNKQIKLSVHHIDYNKENCKETNLITLCVPCNTKANCHIDYWFAYYTYIMENMLYKDSFVCQ